MPKVSVIVPIYNVEKYIERCVRSLFEQTLDDIEYIFVNDCTPDNSILILKKILEEYPKRKPQTKILNHEQNQGQAGARTTGMKAMTGEFMIHCDPDDWVDIDMYETMYNKAKEGNFDIVACNWILEHNNNSIKQNFDYAQTPLDSLTQCKFHPSLWNKLIKTQIVKKLSIYPYHNINCGEDLNVTIRAMYFAKSICVINFHPYHYRYNSSSITNQKHKQIFFSSHLPNVDRICEFLNNKGKDFILLQNYIKFQEKFGLIICNEYKLWSKTWSECHRYIKYFPISKRYRTIMHLIANYPTLLSLYYKYLKFRTK